MKQLACLLTLLCAACALVAQTQSEPAAAGREAAEHERIRVERAAAMLQFATLDANCYQRFAVNDCLAAVRVQRREVLQDLRRQEIALDNAQRKRRAAAQILRADNRTAPRP